jgi:hypothetical protein
VNSGSCDPNSSPNLFNLPKRWEKEREREREREREKEQAGENSYACPHPISFFPFYPVAQKKEEEKRRQQIVDLRGVVGWEILRID